MAKFIIDGPCVVEPVVIRVGTKEYVVEDVELTNSEMKKLSKSKLGRLTGRVVFKMSSSLSGQKKKGKTP